jgi:hypothetical protein
MRLLDIFLVASAQVATSYRLVSPELVSHPAEAISARADDVAGPPSTSQERDSPYIKPRSVEGTFCCPVPGQSWTTAPWYAIEEILNFLDTPNRQFGIVGRICDQLTCGAGGALWLCNDSTDVLWLNGNTLKSYVETMLFDCNGWGNAMCGQTFDTDQWNVVIVGQNKC